MRIIAIGQRIRQDLSQNLEQTLDFEGFYGDAGNNALPLTTRFIKRHSKDLKHVIKMAEKKGYSCPQDLLLSMAIPELAEAVRRYYRGDGPRMVDTLSKEAIGHVDSFLLQWMEGMLSARHPRQGNAVGGTMPRITRLS